MFLFNIQRNKFLMCFISFILIFSLAFCFVSQPFTVHAIAGVDDVIYLIIASVALSLGASIAFNNPDTGALINDIWAHLSEGVKSYIMQQIDSIGFATAGVVSGYSMYFNWSESAWNQITSDILSYFSDYNTNYDSMNFYYSVTPSASGLVGFTDDSSFSFSIPSTYENRNISMHVDLGQSWLDFGLFDGDVLRSLYPTLSVTDSSSYIYRYVRVESSDNLSWVGAYRHLRVQTVQSGNYTSSFSGIVSCYGKLSSPSPNSFSYDVFYNSSYAPSIFVNADGVSYSISSNNGQYALVSSVDGSVYHNLTFSSESALWLWFAESCGIKIKVGKLTSNATQYRTHDVITSKPIDLDVSDAPSIKSNIDSNIVDGTLTTVIPGNMDDLQVLADDPTLIYNPTAAAQAIVIYPADLPQINSGGNFWTTKFPFCIPWDIYTLFFGFYSESEAPVFEWVVMPANSFGLTNDEITLTVDFGDYQVIVNIIQVFIKIIFVGWLILITKKVIK